MDFEDEEDREELRKRIGTKKLAKLEEKEMRRERNAVKRIFEKKLINDSTRVE